MRFQKFFNMLMHIYNLNEATNLTCFIYKETKMVKISKSLGLTVKRRIYKQ